MEKTKREAAFGQNILKKDLGGVVADEADNEGSAEHAIYDGGDANSKANRMVRKIELDQGLNEDERNALLAGQEA